MAAATLNIYQKRIDVILSFGRGNNRKITCLEEAVTFKGKSRMAGNEMVNDKLLGYSFILTGDGYLPRKPRRCSACYRDRKYFSTRMSNREQICPASVGLINCEGFT